MSLSIADYDCRESEAIRRLSYPAIRAFRPAAFIQAGFPTRVTDECELLRYCDIMHELADFDFHYRQRRYSQREAELIAKSVGTIEHLTGSLFDRPTQPVMTPFPPIDILRAVHAFAPGGAKILEIGPGSGLLGSYLINGGFDYSSTDNTQALYLWQNRFFGHLSGNDFCEGVEDDHSAHVTHIPWWQFAGLFKTPPRFDIVICDAALGEMEHFAIWYIIQLAALILRHSPTAVFLYGSIGEPRIASLDLIESIFARFGFKKQVCGSVTVQSLHQLRLPKTFAPVGGNASLRGCDFLKIDGAKMLDSYDFFAFMDMNASASAFRTLRQSHQHDPS